MLIIYPCNLPADVRLMFAKSLLLLSSVFIVLYLYCKLHLSFWWKEISCSRTTEAYVQKFLFIMPILNSSMKYCNIAIKKCEAKFEKLAFSLEWI